MEKEEKELINYFKALGIKVCTKTKARGHQGFFIKNRIDISKNVKPERLIPTLLHEFAHYIHEKLEPNMMKTGGTINCLFNLDMSEDILKYEKELITVTNFVDENSLCSKFKAHKEIIKQKIKNLELEIKKYYPNFMRSKKFKEFNKYIKKSNAKYLLKYDLVKLYTPKLFGLMRKFEILSIDNIEKDFPEMPTAFCAYIKLKSAQKKQARISARINKSNKYYSKPTELFARLVEGLYINEEKIKTIAPNTTKRFFELLENGYYMELHKAFYIINKNFSVNLP